MDKSSILLRTLVDELQDLAEDSEFEAFVRDEIEDLFVRDPIDLDAVRAFFVEKGAAEFYIAQAVDIVIETCRSEELAVVGSGAEVALEGEEDEDDDPDDFDTKTAVAPADVMAMVADLAAKEKDRKDLEAAQAAAKAAQEDAGAQDEGADKSATDDADEPATGDANDDAANDDAAKDDAAKDDAAKVDTAKDDAAKESDAEDGGAVEPDSAPVALDADSLFGDISGIRKAHRDRPIAARDEGVVTAERDVPTEAIAEIDSKKESKSRVDRDSLQPDLPTDPGLQADGFEGAEEETLAIAKERLEQELSGLLEGRDGLPDGFSVEEAVESLIDSVERLEAGGKVALLPLDRHLEVAKVDAKTRTQILGDLEKRSEVIGLSFGLPLQTPADSNVDDAFFQQPEPEAPAPEEPPLDDDAPSDFAPAELGAADRSELPSHSSGGLFAAIVAVVLGLVGVGAWTMLGGRTGASDSVCKMQVEKDGDLMCVVDRATFGKITGERRRFELERVRAMAAERGLSGVTFVDPDGIDLLKEEAKKSRKAQEKDAKDQAAKDQAAKDQAQIAPAPAATGDAGRAGDGGDASTSAAAPQADGGAAPKGG